MLYVFESLNIWKRSILLAKIINLKTKDFPSHKKYGLTSQIRRAAVSVPSNIAEGCGRDSIKQLTYFLSISSGSLCELETQIFISFEMDYLNEVNLKSLVKEIREIRKMIYGFKKHIQKN